MARYIDADLIPYVESENGVLDDFAYRYDINEIPTADVVPKSEVERLEREVETLKDNNEHLAVLLVEEKAEVAMGIFAEIERMCIDTFGNFNHRVFAELKKKYTDGTCSKKEQVEVVRCKDCAHRLTHECHLLFDTDDNKEYYLAMGEDFFCADGERKEQT